MLKKEAKPAKPEAKTIKEDRAVPHPAAKGKKAEPKSSSTIEKPHIHKHEPVKQEKAVSHAKIEEKKHKKSSPTEKSVKPKPAVHEGVKHEKVLQTKADKPKATAKPAAEITVAAQKNTEQAAKEKKEKTVEKKHLKEEKVKEASTVKETQQHHNLTTEKVSKAAKTAKGYTEIISIKKEKAPVRYFQCVFLDGHNGYGLQFPITSAPSHEEKSRHSKASKRKTKAPGQ
ncbi:PREDICTED: triadin-like [Crocodylus porosus]|uniref:triadin-like n=1 Tax=Crocodylus porosus TaxID=8502 RepID=UPI00093A7F75|nr:PREDICTED: triadin-like [Crocodylus porosus]